MQKKIKKLTETSAALGEIGLIIIEDEPKRQMMAKEMVRALNKSGYGRAIDCMEAMDLLEKKLPFYYLEEGVKLNDLILEIIAEYKTGIVSLMDRKHRSGLKTAKFNPNKSPMILVLTRDQVEESGQFFKYIGPIESF